jgi:hypothetical protein
VTVGWLLMNIFVKQGSVMFYSFSVCMDWQEPAVGVLSRRNPVQTPLRGDSCRSESHIAVLVTRYDRRQRA